MVFHHISSNPETLWFCICSRIFSNEKHWVLFHIKHAVMNCWGLGMWPNHSLNSVDLYMTLHCFHALFIAIIQLSRYISNNHLARCWTLSMGSGWKIPDLPPSGWVSQYKRSEERVCIQGVSWMAGNGSSNLSNWYISIWLQRLPTLWTSEIPEIPTPKDSSGNRAFEKCVSGCCSCKCTELHFGFALQWEDLLLRCALWSKDPENQGQVTELKSHAGKQQASGPGHLTERL